MKNSKLNNLIIRFVLLVCCVGLFLGCSGNVNTNAALQCERGLDSAYRELDYAKARGFSGTVAWGKAHTLLAAAKTQQQFEKYPNCVEKVNRARKYIKASQR